MDRRSFLGWTLATPLAGGIAGTISRSHAQPPQIVPTPANPKVPSAVPGDRLARLAAGVNLSHWMWYPHAKGEAQRRAYVPKADLQTLARVGLTHVRLPFEPGWIWDEQRHRLRPEPWQEYLDATRLCLDAGLAVIIDAHWSNTEWIRPKATSANERFGELTRMWQDLSERVEREQLDPERVFLELLNEPHDLESPAHWHDVQRDMVTEVRARAAKYTIIVTGADWGGIDGLSRLTPLDDANLVYSFHFYDPMNFTHQGATWGFPPWAGMKNVPWPATPAEIEKAAARLSDEESKKTLRWSGRAESSDPWTKKLLVERLNVAKSWSKTHGVPVYCGEFGVHAAPAPKDSRIAWHRAVGDTLRTAGIGMAMWDYVGGFALATGDPGKRTPDPQLVRSLVGPRAPAKPNPDTAAPPQPDTKPQSQPDSSSDGSAPRSP